VEKMLKNGRNSMHVFRITITVTRCLRLSLFCILLMCLTFLLMHLWIKYSRDDLFVLPSLGDRCDVPINIPTYVISVRGSERNSKFLREAALCFKNLVVIDAVTDEMEAFSVIRIHSWDAAVYCLASHIKAIQSAYLNGHRFALILEDDITLEFIGLFRHYLQYSISDIAAAMDHIDYTLLYYTSPAHAIVGGSNFSSTSVSNNLHDFIKYEETWEACNLEQWRCCFVNCNEWGAAAYIVNTETGANDLKMKLNSNFQGVRFLASDYVLYEGMSVKKHVPPLFGHYAGQSTFQTAYQVSLQEGWMNRLRHDWAFVLQEAYGKSLL